MLKYLIAVTLPVMLLNTPVSAQKMVAHSPIAQNTSAVGVIKAPRSHSMLVNVLNVAGVKASLNNSSDYTIFAPTNNAFAKFPKNTLNALLQPENKSELKSIMTYHVVRGNLRTEDLKRAVAEGDGAATLQTLEGDSLILRQSGNKLILTDTTGRSSTVSASTSQLGSNVVHAVDRILMPRT